MTTPFRGRTLAAAATLLALLATTACGGSSEGADKPAVSGSAAPSTDASDTPSATSEPEYRTEFNVVEPVIKPSAIETFGAKETSRAVSAALAFVHDFAYDDEIATFHTKKERDDLKAALLAMEPRFTNDYAIEWRKDVEFALANGGTKSQSAADVFVAAAFGWGNQKGKVRHEGVTYQWRFDPFFVNKTIRSAVAWQPSNAPGHIRVRIKSFADARTSINGAPALKRMTRDQNLLMKKEQGSWKVWLGGCHYAFKMERPEA